MLTSKQKQWLNHLTNETKITIKEYDPKSPEIFKRVKAKIQSYLGKVGVFHRGASSMKISGQDEIDVYIPVKPSDFDSCIPKLENMFGPAKSIYPVDRARFYAEEHGKKIDLFLINQASDGWLKGEKFHKYLMSHKKSLAKYKKLKEKCNGCGVKDYYTRKIEFINEIIGKAS